MTATPKSAPMMDLSAFIDRDTSLALATRCCPKAYTAIAKRHMMGREHITGPMMLFQSFVSRMRGLHEAILREIEADNPHGAFPLMRAWAEGVALAIYVTKKPAYIDAMMNDPREGGPGRKTDPARPPLPVVRAAALTSGVEVNQTIANQSPKCLPHVLRATPDLLGYREHEVGLGESAAGLGGDDAV